MKNPFLSSSMITKLTESWQSRQARCTPRERVMLAGLFGVGMFLLLTLGLRISLKTWSYRRDAGARLEAREQLLARAPEVAAALVTESSRLKGGTDAGADMLGSLDALARECGLSAEASTPGVERNGKLVLNRVRLALRAPALAKLMVFDDKLAALGSSMFVEKVVLAARSENGEVSAVYEVVSCRVSE